MKKKLKIMLGTACITALSTMTVFADYLNMKKEVEKWGDGWIEVLLVFADKAFIAGIILSVIGLVINNDEAAGKKLKIALCIFVVLLLVLKGYTAFLV